MKSIFALGLLFTVTSWAQQYTPGGELVFPKDYREWVFLSSGIGMTYNSGTTPNANPPFENVFVNQTAFQSFLKTGTWPDKTVMILEIRSSESRVSINKDGRVQTKIVAIEAHVKDAGKGGWAFYKFPDGGQPGALFPKTANCYSCHQQNAATDTTFVQFYPTLIEIARSKNNYRETGH